MVPYQGKHVWPDRFEWSNKMAQELGIVSCKIDITQVYDQIKGSDRMSLTYLVNDVGLSLSLKAAIADNGDAQNSLGNLNRLLRRHPHESLICLLIARTVRMDRRLGPLPVRIVAQILARFASDPQYLAH